MIIATKRKNNSQIVYISFRRKRRNDFNLTLLVFTLAQIDDLSGPNDTIQYMQW